MTIERWAALTLATCLLGIGTVATRMGRRPEGGVLSELIRSQARAGTTLASYYRGLDLVSFARRDMVHRSDLIPEGSLQGVISRDGSELAVQIARSGGMFGDWLGIVRPDGSALRKYDDAHPTQMCWSYDDSRLAVTIENSTPDTRLQLLDVKSGQLGAEIDPRARITSQCWSPDGEQITYEADDTVRVSNVKMGASSVRVLAQGTYPTWSPDGNWIAFLDRDTYYEVRPDGTGQRELFKKWHAASGLYWSPDSRIVAFVSEVGWLEGGVHLDVELYRLRVRRLADNSEDWVTDDGPTGGYEWVSGPSFLVH